MLVFYGAPNNESCNAKVTGHHIQSLIDHDFDVHVKLIKPTAASKKLASYVRTALELPDDTCVLSSTTSRHSKFAVSSVGDVVLHYGSDGTMHAGQVWAHFAIDNECITLLQEFELVSADREQDIAKWRILGTPVLCATEDIVDPVIWNEYDRGIVRTILPCDR